MIVGLIIARPFLLPRARPPRLTERQALLAQKDALLAQIRALDFDAETGKQLPEEYTAEREMLMQRATAVLASLAETQEMDDEIEAAVARLKTLQANVVLGGKETTAVNFCPQCGAAVQPQDRFCTNCGAPLAATPHTDEARP